MDAQNPDITKFYPGYGVASVWDIVCGNIYYSFTTGITAKNQGFLYVQPSPTDPNSFNNYTDTMHSAPASGLTAMIIKSANCSTVTMRDGITGKTARFSVKTQNWE